MYENGQNQVIRLKMVYFVWSSSDHASKIQFWNVEHFNTSLYKKTRAKLKYRRSSKDQCLLHFTRFFCTQTITANTFLKQTETLYINRYYKYEGKVRWWSWSIEHFWNGGLLKKQPIFLILRLVWEDYALHLNFIFSW